MALAYQSASVYAHGGGERGRCFCRRVSVRLRGCRLPHQQHRDGQCNGESNTITLEEGTYTLTTVNNETEGPNGLPSITSALALIGAGMEKTIIEHDGEDEDIDQFGRGKRPPFRILHVEENGHLIMEDLTIQKGWLSDSPGNGGGLSNYGEVTVKNSAVLNNAAAAFGVGGGGIYNRGVLSVLNSRIEGNIADNANGGAGIYNDSEGILTMLASWVLYNFAGGQMEVALLTGARSP